MMIRRILFSLSFAAVFAICSLVAGRSRACPYCSPVQPTFTQNFQLSDAAAMVELVELPPGSEDGGAFAPGLGDTIPKSKFKVLEVLKGAELLKNTKQIEVIYFGDSPVGTQFLLTAVDPKSLTWAMPIPLSKRGRQYVTEALKLPESGPERLAFFMNYLEDKEDMLRQDAYDEFASSSYEDMRALGPKMPHDDLIARIQNPEITGSHRRLYFTMLGVCGKKDDIPLLESLLKSEDRKQREGLDAIIGCYLAIKGPEGLHLVEDLYLKKNDNFIDTNSALQAVRIAEESTILKKEDSAAAFRRLLDNPKMADLVIPDLARWQDWTAIDQLVDLYVKADPESNWVRVPVLRYLQVCPLPEAKRYLTKLEKLDPDSAKRASAFPALSGLINGAKAPAGSKSPATATGK